MTLILQKEGMFTSLQNTAGKGSQTIGINPRGPMDRFAARVANLLVGNDEDENVLEMHFPAAQIEFWEECRFALAGACFGAVLDGSPIRNWGVHKAGGGCVIKFESKGFGTRAYMSIDGGMKSVPNDSGDLYSTEKLTRGALIERRFGKPTSYPGDRYFASKDILPAYATSPVIRIIPSGEFDRLADDSVRRLAKELFAVTNDSNRMGFRLKGSPLELIDSCEMVSAAVTFGTIQLVPDGQLIVLMADHQTAGGYPRIANVISADLPILGQLGPGDMVSFVLIGIGEAEQAALQIETDLKKLRTGVRFGRYW